MQYTDALSTGTWTGQKCLLAWCRGRQHMQQDHSAKFLNCRDKQTNGRTDGRTDRQTEGHANIHFLKHADSSHEMDLNRMTAVHLAHGLANGSVCCRSWMSAGNSASEQRSSPQLQMLCPLCSQKSVMSSGYHLESIDWGYCPLVQLRYNSFLQGWLES